MPVVNFNPETGRGCCRRYKNLLKIKADNVRLRREKDYWGKKLEDATKDKKGTGSLIRRIERIDRNINTNNELCPIIFMHYETSILAAPAHQHIAHCVSLCKKMSRGAAAELASEYRGLRDVVVHSVGDIGVYLVEESGRLILNLVTKHLAHQKPSEKNFEVALTNLSCFCKRKEIEYIAITKLGCGEDKLSWDDFVLPLIERLFRNMMIEIHVYCLHKNTAC